MDDKIPNEYGKIAKLFYVLIGHLSLVLGLLGIVLPLLPTTPFLLLAATCYIRGSESSYEWLINHRILGPFIKNYREGKGIPKNLKITLLALVWITIPSSSLFLVQKFYIKLLLILIAIVISAVLLRLPTITKVYLENENHDHNQVKHF